MNREPLSADPRQVDSALRAQLNDISAACQLLQRRAQERDREYLALIYRGTLRAMRILEQRELARRLEGKEPINFPRETAMGAMALYISDQSVVNFQPMNVNFGLIPPLGYRVKGKRNKNAELSKRALEALGELELS